jgi:tetratricopeptide (TPR) repeat protein
MVGPTIWDIYTEIAQQAYKSGDTDLADSMLQAALTEANRLAAQTSSTTVNIDKLVDIYLEQKKFDKVEKLYRTKLRQYKQILGRSHPTIGKLFFQLAEFYFDRGQLTRAKAMYDKSLLILEKPYGADSSQLERIYFKLSWIRLQKGNVEEAAELLKRARSIGGRTKPQSVLPQTPYPQHDFSPGASIGKNPTI